jgi:hypothetical protein
LPESDVGIEQASTWEVNSGLQIAIPHRLKNGSEDIDIIHYLEGLTDKLLYFTLYTEFVLIMFFWKTLSKPLIDFDSYKLSMVDFAH